MNNITIEFCKEDRQRIDEVVSWLSLFVSTVQGQRITPEDILAKSGIQTRSMTTAEDGTVKLVEHPADAPATHLEAPQPEPEVEGQISLFDESTPDLEANPAPIVVSLAEFQKAVTMAVSKGPEAKKAAKAIINKYATSVSGVPEDKRSEVMAELAKI